MNVLIEVQLSTCKGSNFDTHLALFDVEPTKNATSTVMAENEHVTTLEFHPDATVVAESTNDILCKESILWATLEVTLAAWTKCFEYALCVFVCRHILVIILPTIGGPLKIMSDIDDKTQLNIFLFIYLFSSFL